MQAYWGIHRYTHVLTKVYNIFLYKYAVYSIYIKTYIYIQDDSHDLGPFCKIPSAQHMQEEYHSYLCHTRHKETTWQIRLSDGTQLRVWRIKFVWILFQREPLTFKSFKFYSKQSVMKLTFIPRYFSTRWPWTLHSVPLLRPVSSLVGHPNVEHWASNFDRSPRSCCAKPSTPTRPFWSHALNNKRLVKVRLGVVGWLDMIGGMWSRNEAGMTMEMTEIATSNNTEWLINCKKIEVYGFAVPVAARLT